MNFISQKKFSEANLERSIRLIQEDIKSLEPKSFAERNYFSRNLLWVLSWPLQLLSVGAGAYLWLDVMIYLFRLESSISISIIFVSFLALYVFIEYTRRMYVRESGEHFLRTFVAYGKGEYLSWQIFVLSGISICLIVSGVYGTYTFVKKNSPTGKESIVNVKEANKETTDKINENKRKIDNINKDIKSAEAQKQPLKNAEGAYDWAAFNVNKDLEEKITKSLESRRTYEDMVLQLEKKLENREDKLEAKNEDVISKTLFQSESLSIIAGLIWLLFEFFILYFISFEYMYQVGVAREMDITGQLPRKTVEYQPYEESEMGASHRSRLEGERQKRNMSVVKQLEPEDTLQKKQNPIGFQVSSKKQEKPQVEIVERIIEIPVEKIHEKIFLANEGYKITCENENCGKEAVMDHVSAKYCSTKCRVASNRMKNKKKKEVSKAS